MNVLAQGKPEASMRQHHVSQNVQEFAVNESVGV